MLLFLLTASTGAFAENAHYDWSSLQDGLVAWEFFGFDANFTYEVQVGGKSVFNYPKGSSEASTVDLSAKPEIIISGAKSHALESVTTPHVQSIVSGKAPGASSGRGSVARLDLLDQGGGLTLPGLVKASGGRLSEGGDEWQILRDGIDAWAALNLDVDFSVNVGNKDGTLFTYTKGNTDMNTRLRGASLSKWPAAMTISGLVKEGILSYDDKVSKHLPWWTTDPQDMRSAITLRDLLSFQSGYMADSSVDCSHDADADYLSCVKSLYETAKHSKKPGTAFAYLSIHLQFAGAVAVAASGLDPDELFEKYLYKLIGSNSTTWTPPKNPSFATGITTTGNDFEKLLQKVLTYDDSFLSKGILEEMEKDWGARASPSGDGWFGHYAMGHWFDCMGYAAGQLQGGSAPLTKLCLDENIPAGPGAYGYFPLVDRARGYYFQIVLAEDSQCRSEIPEYLRIIAKPVVDAIVQKMPVDDEHLLASSGGLLLRDLVDMYNYVPPQCNPDSTVV